MFEFLDRIRQKPEAVRKTIALFGAGTLSAIVVLGWLTTFSLRFPDATGRETLSDGREGQEMSAFDTAAVASIYSDVRNEADQAKAEVLSGFTQLQNENEGEAHSEEQHFEEQSENDTLNETDESQEVEFSNDEPQEVFENENEGSNEEGYRYYEAEDGTYWY